MVPTSRKISIFQALITAGIRSLELGSFVHPGLVPQMADAEALFEQVKPEPDVHVIALVPNARGARRALAAGVTEVRVVLSCSEGHSRANTNRSVAEGVEETRAVVEILAPAGVRVTGALATAFVCPFDGIVPAEQVVRLSKALVDMGLHEVSLADTLGRADPRQVDTTVGAVRDALPSSLRPAPAQHVRHGVGQRGCRAEPRHRSVRLCARGYRRLPVRTRRGRQHRYRRRRVHVARNGNRHRD